jgi:hypothetical protein
MNLLNKQKFLGNEDRILKARYEFIFLVNCGFHNFVILTFFEIWFQSPHSVPKPDLAI